MKRLVLLAILTTTLAGCNQLSSSISTDQAYADDQVYMGYPCLESCDQFEVGYKWAKDNQITEVINCSGETEAEIIGCKAYVTEYHYNDQTYQELIEGFESQAQ